ncbi:hypothetical protein ACEN30_09270 [Marinilactibacillus psychrotolerans]|uniref:hypothetical protein n=1 Tax=Marinilactibacillus psychrotolerans TaxID=191770 RepID=UPI00388A9F72
MSSELQSINQASGEEIDNDESLNLPNTEENNISEINLQNNLGENLTFTRVNIELNPAKKYREVKSTTSTVASKTTQGALPFLASAQTVAGISKQAPFGLFTATVDPALLSKFTADGSFSTIIRDGSKIIKNAGFKKVSINPVNSVALIGAAMQAMALASGQYYMHQINSQLTGIGELVNFHHDEKMANLLTTKERLGRVSSKSTNDITDLNEIRNLLDDTRNDFHEYKTRLDREHTALINDEFKEKITKNKLNDLMGKLDQMNFTYQMCFEADKLSLQIEIAEIAIQMKLGYTVQLIKEKIALLKENYSASFYYHTEDEIKKLYRPIRSNAVTKKETDKSVARYQKILEKQKYLDEILTFADANVIIEKMLVEYDRPREVIYVPGDERNNERVFVLEE